MNRIGKSLIKGADVIDFKDLLGRGEIVRGDYSLLDIKVDVKGS